MTATKILNSLLEPFSSVEYYKKASNKPVLKSLLLFVVMISLLGVIQGIQLIAQNTQPTLNTLEKIKTDFVSNYPEDLQFNWENKTLSYQYHSLEENPEYISVPFSSHIPVSQSSLTDNFAYITNSETTPEKENITTQGYMFFVTPTKIFVSESVSSNTWAEYAISKVFENEASFAIDKSMVETVTQNLLTAIQENTAQLQLTALVVFCVLFFLGKVWFLCIETLLAFLFLKLNSITLTVKQTISLSIHILITTAVIATLAELIYQNITFPLHTLSFWVVLFYISYQWKKAK